MRPRSRAPLPAAMAMLVLTACTLTWPDQSATPHPDGPQASAAPTATPSPTPQPTPTPIPEVEVPLAVVTGYTNPIASITEAEVRDAIAADTVVQACELFPAANPGPRCLQSDAIAAHLVANPSDIALLPAGLVVPTIKVLPVDGADLFGNAEARSRPWPFTMRIAGPPPEWEFRPDDVRTLISFGDTCPDRGVAYAAITLGRGWEWVFGGGTAEYTAVYPNPVPDGSVGNGFNIVDAVPSGNEGAVAQLVSGADVTLADFECPVVDDWTVNDGVVFSIDPAVLPQLRDTYGVDVATLAANHLFDRGTPGFLETLAKFDAAGIARAGVGADLEEALEPALVDVNGMSFAFLGFNEIPGSLEAGPGQPGVLWLRDENVTEAVGRARTAGADLVVCVPQWWGGAEYHAEFRGDMRRQQQVFFDAGCDQVVGHGTHWSGPIEITPTDDGDHRVTMVSHGNFLFGQEWSQQTQEGVILELAFHGTELAQARMHPYIMLEQAQANLTDPATDGLYVLNRIYEASGLPVVAPAPPPAPGP